MKTIIITLVLSTLLGCGKEQMAEKIAESAPTPSSVETSTETSTSTAVASSTSDPVVPAAPTAEQTYKFSVLYSFNSAYKKGAIFHVPGRYYFARGASGTLRAPDHAFVGADVKDAGASCPLGFAMVDQAQLSLGKSFGLLGAIVPSKRWVWTSERPSGTPLFHYALITEDYVRTDDGHAYSAGETTILKDDAFDGEVYCAMRTQDLPKFEDLPKSLQEVLEADHLATE